MFIMKKHFVLWLVIAAAFASGIYGVWKLAKNGSLPSTTKPYAAAVATTVQTDDHSMGPENAKVTLIEYSDFQCPACAAYEPLLQELRKEFGASMIFAYRHFPLPQHANAEPAARASEAAGIQGKFWEMHDLLLKNQDKWKDAANAEEIFSRYAVSIGLDEARFKNDFASKEVKNKVATDSESAKNLYLNSTPTFFLNGKKIENPRSYDEFKSLIDGITTENQ